MNTASEVLEWANWPGDRNTDARRSYDAFKAARLAYCVRVTAEVERRASAKAHWADDGYERHDKYICENILEAAKSYDPEPVI